MLWHLRADSKVNSELGAVGVNEEVLTFNKHITVVWEIEVRKTVGEGG